MREYLTKSIKIVQVLNVKLRTTEMLVHVHHIIIQRFLFWINLLTVATR